MPGNLHIAGREIPLGLVGIALVLFATALLNLFTKQEFTKQEATIAGVAFSLVFFGAFTKSK